MAEYLFFPTADAAQDDIWNYTVKQWEEKQAESYIRNLHNHLQELADKERFWHKLPNKAVIPQDLNLNAYFSKHNHYYIFFKELSVDKIGIISILHEKSDLPIRLRKDLTKFMQK